MSDLETGSPKEPQIPKNPEPSADDLRQSADEADGSAEQRVDRLLAEVDGLANQAEDLGRAEALGDEGADKVAKQPDQSPDFLSNDDSPPGTDSLPDMQGILNDALAGMTSQNPAFARLKSIILKSETEPVVMVDPNGLPQEKQAQLAALDLGEMMTGFRMDGPEIMNYAEALLAGEKPPSGNPLAKAVGAEVAEEMAGGLGAREAFARVTMRYLRGQAERSLAFE